jgi:hypothetical protein
VSALWMLKCAARVRAFVQTREELQTRTPKAAVITNCDHLTPLKFLRVCPSAFDHGLFEALSLRLRLAAAQCGKPMAFRSPPTHFLS